MRQFAPFFSSSSLCDGIYGRLDGYFRVPIIMVYGRRLFVNYKAMNLTSSVADHQAYSATQRLRKSLLCSARARSDSLRSRSLKMQNTSHAVMSQRVEPDDSLDDFPTPPWATRALIEHVLTEHKPLLRNLTCLEPACGAGHMAKVLKEYFREVGSWDIFNYGYGGVRDFLTYPYEESSWDWVITNPPFNLGEE